MATININLVSDLQKAVEVKYIDGNLFSQDVQANTINVTVLDGGEPATLSGTVTANIIRSDGGTVAATGGSIADNVVSITLPAAAYAIPGVVSIIVKLTASGVTTSIAAIVANVYRSTTDTTVDPGTIIPSVQALISQINTAIASIPADYSSLWETLAPAYSNTSLYANGQYVTNGGALYRCNTPVTTAGDWSTNSSHFTAVNIGGELSDLKSAITDESTIRYKALNEDDVFVSSWISNKYINTSGVVENGGSTVAITNLIDVSTAYSFDFVGGTAAILKNCAFYDSNKTLIPDSLLASASLHVDKSNYPSGTKYVRFCTTNNSGVFTSSGYTLHLSKRLNDLEETSEIVSAKINTTNALLNAKDQFVSSWIAGKRIDENGAVVNNATHFAITDFIDVSDAFAFEYNGALYMGLAYPVVYYNQNKQKLGNYKVAGGSYAYIPKSDFPEGIKYVRCCAYKANDDFTSCGYIVHTLKRVADIEEINLAASKSAQKPNIINGLRESINKFYYDDSGRIAENNYYVAGKAKIEVKPETKYSIGLEGQRYDLTVKLCYYQENMAFISKESHTNTQSFTTPALCKYMTICVDNSTISNLDKIFIIEADADGRTVPCVNMNNSFNGVFPRTNLKGKKWTLFGDSITANTFRSGGNYHDFVRGETGIITYNKGVGGSGYKCLDESNKATYQLALADIEGWSDSDIITCMSGINDCMFMLPPTGNRTELGTYTDVFVEPQDITSYTSNTLMACFNKFISVLEANAPSAHIGIISPLPTDYTLSGTRYLFKPEDDTNNLSKFVEECKKACYRKGIAYLDLYHTCHLMPWVTAVNNKYYKCYSNDSPDGLHPNVYGHEWIYPAIREFLKSMF